MALHRGSILLDILHTFRTSKLARLQLSLISKTYLRCMTRKMVRAERSGRHVRIGIGDTSVASMNVFDPDSRIGVMCMGQSLEPIYGTWCNSVSVRQLVGSRGIVRVGCRRARTAKLCKSSEAR